MFVSLKPKVTTMNNQQPNGKKEEIKQALEAKNYKRAFSIARKFFFGISTDLMRSIEIAADAANGRTSFYVSIGVDTTTETEKAINGLMQFVS